VISSLSASVHLFGQGFRLVSVGLHLQQSLLALFGFSQSVQQSGQQAKSF